MGRFLDIAGILEKYNCFDINTDSQTITVREGQSISSNNLSQIIKALAQKKIDPRHPVKSSVTMPLLLFITSYSRGSLADGWQIKTELSGQVYSWIKDIYGVKDSLVECFSSGLQSYPDAASRLYQERADTWWPKEKGRCPDSYVEFIKTIVASQNKATVTAEAKEAANLEDKLDNYIKRANKEISSAWQPTFFGRSLLVRKPNQRLNKQVAEDLKKYLEIGRVTQNFDKLRELNKDFISNLRGRGKIRSTELNTVIHEIVTPKLRAK